MRIFLPPLAPVRSFAMPCLVAGSLCFGVGAISLVLSRNIFDAHTFGNRAAESLSDPGVSAWAADRITKRIVHRKPDLIAFRPFLMSGVETLVSNNAFRSVVKRAAARAHESAFSEGAERVLLSIPDLNILVREALKNASPGLVARIPKSLDTTIASISNGKTAAAILTVGRIGKRLRWVWLVFFGGGIAFYTLALWLSIDRRKTMARTGFSLIATGLLLSGFVAANVLAGIWIHDAKELGLIRGLWRTYLSDFNRWGLLFAGLGVLIASGAASLLERIDLFEQFSRLARAAATPPRTYSRRLIWGFSLFVCGSVILSYPAVMLSFVAVLTGIWVAYVGSRELFRVFAEAVDSVPHTVPGGELSAAPHRGLVAALIGCLVLVLGTGWFLWRNPVAVASQATPEVLACNGFPELCDRHVDEVVFPGAHNAMSNQDAPGWMFPHHERGMAQMLQDGIRALLVDIHYGFAGGARIKTDMRTEPTADLIKRAVGEEGYAAAMRIRDRLVGVDERRRGLYFCHGFCELGAYPVGPTLNEIREFMVTHPDEVIIVIVEDTVTPEDLASEFERAGFTGLIYTGAPATPWPTLRMLIESGRRALVFTESGSTGVPWLRPAFDTFRETPYTFHKAEEFSCRANRGGERGSLLQINHWIETTPTPKPSNAAIVNAYDFLLSRAEQCAAERGHLPNLLAVDFYRTGDLFAVVNKLNGVGESDRRSSISE